jgi:hypothetical protein
LEALAIEIEQLINLDAHPLQLGAAAVFVGMLAKVFEINHGGSGAWF